jgi:hypothetical protein
VSDFQYRTAKNRRVFISREGRQVTALRGGAAERFLDRVRDSDEDQAKLEMARVTGNYKRGNER